MVLVEWKCLRLAAVNICVSIFQFFPEKIHNGFVTSPSLIIDIPSIPSI